MSNATPKVESIRKNRGIAGQVSYTATVKYAGETRFIRTFVGSVYGETGAVVMVREDGRQTFVSDPGRFGSFGESWVRRFYGESL